MADIQLLGLFRDVEQVSLTIEQARKAGVTDGQMDVLSNMPINHKILGRPKPSGLVARMALLGAVLGALAAIGLVAGTGQLYPLDQGNQSIIPIPPMLIVTFEITMLGTMWMAFLGMLISNGFPAFKKQAYHPQISSDSIGLLVKIDENAADGIKKIFNDFGALRIQEEPASQAADQGNLRFWVGFGVFLALAAGVTGLFLYDIVRIPFPSQMVEQESVAAQQGPRLAAPVEAVPIQGRVLSNGLPSSKPVPASPDSLQRGQVLYNIDCVLCHGPRGVGDGSLLKLLEKKPADLSSSQVQNLADEDIYVVINQGFGTMPGLAENLNPQDGWDVANYVRTLKK